MAETIERDLTAWLGEELRDPGLRIDGLRRTSVGYSRENWVFDAAWQADGKARAQPFIARRDPAGSVLETDRRLEFAILSALADTNIPVPRVRWLDADGARLGRPSIVMDLADGVCDYMVLNGNRPPDRRLAIAHRLYDRMADIHLLDWRALGLDKVLENPGNKAALAALDYWEAELRRVQLEPEPELELVIAWLRERAPDNEAVTLVHGDFKPGNVLMQGDEVTLVLDWETAHLGDPLEDIGWVTNPLRAGEHRIPDAWEPSDLIARWSERTGFSADSTAVRWWNVLANFKQAMTVLTGKHAFADGRFDRILHEPVAIYRLLFNLIEA
ncbi:MAG TPA: phosphotransferase family protein [Alphaproteobacteria bacterium]|jgi:aminoglycoside phosphotransferase (APT) family kinase protein|nr:phosphotransferase family protein [Alphaproteobacteria bacterium]